MGSLFNRRNAVKTFISFCFLFLFWPVMCQGQEAPNIDMSCPVKYRVIWEKVYGALKKDNPMWSGKYQFYNGVDNALELHIGILDLQKLNTLKFDDYEGLEKIDDISALKQMPLSSFYLQGTNIKDIKPLSEMQLIYLSLQGSNNIEDFTPIGGILSLRGLNMTDTRVSDISFLAKLKLTRLFLSNTGVADISPLKGMPLAELDLSFTRVHDLSMLCGMKLKRLDIASTPISDITPLRGMPIEYLNLNFTKVSNISATKGMPLKEISMNSTLVLDLSPLDGDELDFLDIKGAPAQQKPAQQQALNKDRWDVCMARNSGQWNRLILISSPSAIILTDKILNDAKISFLEFCKNDNSGQYSCDYKLTAAWIASRNNPNEAVDIIGSMERYSDVRSILSPNFDATNYPVDDLLCQAAPYLYSSDIHGNIRVKHAFGECPSAWECMLLKYFDHLESRPRMASEVAACFLALCYEKLQQPQAAKFLSQQIDAQWETAKETRISDEMAAKDEYGMYIFCIHRPFYSMNWELANIYEYQNEADKEISVLEKFASAFCLNGWYFEFNEKLGDAYLKRGKNGDIELAKKQYFIVKNGIMLYYKNLICRYLIDEPNRHMALSDGLMESLKARLQTLNNKMHNVNITFNQDADIAEIKVWCKDELKRIDSIHALSK